MEIHTCSDGLRRREREALCRLPITLSGLQYWSPRYAAWFCKQEAVELVRLAPHGKAAIASGRDGSSIEVPRVSLLDESRLEAFDALQKLWAERALLTRRAAEEAYERAPWYVKLTLEAGITRERKNSLVQAYRKCEDLKYQSRTSLQTLKLPSYSTFVRHVRKIADGLAANSHDARYLAYASDAFFGRHRCRSLRLQGISVAGDI